MNFQVMWEGGFRSSERIWLFDTQGKFWDEGKMKEYGKPAKIGDIIAFYHDMKNGIICVSINGENFGLAVQSNKLKNNDMLRKSFQAVCGSYVEEKLKNKTGLSVAKFND